MNKTSVTQEVDLAISHHQIQVRSRDFDEDLCQWGEHNVEQGAVIHPGYITFGPIPDDTFGAWVKLALCEKFEEDPLAQRRMVVPFDVIEPEKLELLSVPMSAMIELPLELRRYALYYEICEDEEVYYRMTFVPEHEPLQAMYLMEDEWGGEAGKPLREGRC
ncbi:competence protein ComJ [Paenibacillus sp. N3/727]|uniref:competence protein ComJ n=1 Tax=Paenibacillus sp. N3/727 TaxID=2925845 RepID=UPI001F5385D7|nr:competence protein ComJ [Paenibacillus sp. N3/727]UNK17166.1 competence protein ComJ [Paenibacillus sp. N3/727]